MKKKIWTLLIVLVAGGVLFWQFQLRKEVNCTKEMEYLFSEFPGYFESFEKGVEWCNECVDSNGIPWWSPTGPFCNLKTSDGGKTCTDSSQCEGICLAENEDSTFGKCSDTEYVLGCGFEMCEGRALEVCRD